MGIETVSAKRKSTAADQLHLCLRYGTIPIFLGIWELLSRWIVSNPITLPAPSLILTTFWSMLTQGTLLQDSLSSIGRILIGYFFGGILGIAMGVLTGSSTFAYGTLGQILRLLRSLSVVALVPFSIVWFGFSESGKYFLIAWGVFFVVWMNTHVGVSGVDRRFVWAARTLGMPKYRILGEVLVMAALQTIMGGLRTGVGVAMICVVAAEMGSSGVVQGLGYRVEFSYQLFRTDQMSAALLMICLIGLALDQLYVVVTRKIFPWIQWNI